MSGIVSSCMDWVAKFWDEEFGFRDKNKKRRLNIKVCVVPSCGARDDRSPPTPMSCCASAVDSQYVVLRPVYLFDESRRIHCWRHERHRRAAGCHAAASQPLGKSLGFTCLARVRYG